MKHIILAILCFLLPLNTVMAPLPYKVLVCGVCKNIGREIKHSIRIMEKIGELFEDYRIIIYENNSTDHTDHLLCKHQVLNPKIFALCEHMSTSTLNALTVNRLSNGDYFKTELIAYARNKVLDIAFSPTYEQYSHIIWMDMDFILEPNYAGIEEVFTSDKEWDAVFAYGVDPYYKYWDWYAFRDHRCPIGPELLDMYWWKLPKQLILDQKNDWYPVYSAFGGCGIYKKSSIENCYYSGLVTSDLALFTQKIIEEYKNSNIHVQKYIHDKNNTKKYVTIADCSPKLPAITDPHTGIRIHTDCDIVWKMNSFTNRYPVACEHVPFHASMILNGHNKLFINPRLVFHYGRCIK